MSNGVVCQEASHARVWYTTSGLQLNAQLEGWFSQVQKTKRPARTMIAPHAGYICTVGLVLHMLTNKWIHLLPGEFSSLGLLIMCPSLDVHFPVWIHIGHLCMTFVLTKKFMESYGRQECLNA
uniref:Uncharacterized protein n=1 Tax=Sciurus vulgaris TaxID=55149 RepID=A0A8D2AXA7_SCIVU